MTRSTWVTFCRYDRPVLVEVFQEYYKVFAGNQFEPPDYRVVRTEIFVNGFPADPNKYSRIVDHVLTYGE